VNTALCAVGWELGVGGCSLNAGRLTLFLLPIALLCVGSSRLGVLRFALDKLSWELEVGGYSLCAGRLALDKLSSELGVGD